QILKSSQASADEIMREDPVIRDLLSQAAILTSEHDEPALMSTFQDLVKKLCAAASFRVFSYAWNRLLFIYNLEMQKFNLPEEEFSPDIRQNDFHNIDDAMRALIVLYHKLFAGIRRKLYVGNELIEKSLIYMSKHYARCLSLADVANHVNVSSAYLSRLFSKETGLSFVDHLNQIRISKAQELLKDRKIRINEVADQVGYTNAKYFSQVFRKIIGCTPYDFKIKGC
ncbi:MAG TPA: helix-turn-helix domain-containing protein, partial [Anaerovoracaceae bacterium]|nr:helix-turn-helix domain-containing protein [Anaerovoracaceae bacterium]